MIIRQRGPEVDRIERRNLVLVSGRTVHRMRSLIEPLSDSSPG